MFDGFRQGVFWHVRGNKKKTHSFGFVGDKKLFNYSMLEEKKQKTKTVQTSSKINFTDHVFYSDDSVFVWCMTCNNHGINFFKPFSWDFLFY